MQAVEGVVEVSNSYLCDECIRVYREPFDPVVICEVNMMPRDKVVVPDGYEGDLSELCAWWKKR